MCVEFRPVDAGKLRFASYQYPAASAHAGAVDHDRIETYIGGDALRPRECGKCSHHRHWADSENSLRAGYGIGDKIGKFHGDEALATHTAVFGSDQPLAGKCGQLVLQNNQVISTSADDGRNLIARVGQCLCQRIEHCGSNAAAYTSNAPPALYMSRLAERSGYVAQETTGRGGYDHARRCADSLNEQCYGPVRSMCIPYGQGNALFSFSQANYDELSRFPSSRNPWRPDYHTMERRADNVVA